MAENQKPVLTEDEKHQYRNLFILCGSIAFVAYHVGVRHGAKDAFKKGQVTGLLAAYETVLS